jgi:hypothetical protein
MGKYRNAVSGIIELILYRLLDLYRLPMFPSLLYHSERRRIRSQPPSAAHYRHTI